MYASSSEIKKYFEDFAHKYELGQYIKNSHRVDHAEWLEGDGKWSLRVADLEHGTSFTDQCDIFINAGGYLNNWAWPDVPGRLDFEGHMVHSAHWDDSVEIEGKKVLLIGNGYVLLVYIKIDITNTVEKIICCTNITSDSAYCKADNDVCSISSMDGTPNIRQEKDIWQGRF